MTIKLGRVRLKLADALIDQFAADGIEIRVDPSKLWPAEGFWRTSMIDCYVWEGQIEIKSKHSERFQVISIDSYERMTDCAKGLSWQEEGHRIQIFADNPTPIALRSKRGA